MRTLCLLLVWMSTLLLAWCASEPAAAPAPGQTRRVVRQYALTSANDFPQRDPQGWRLLGSNDGGKTWQLLDVRRGEVFGGRHERRVFATTNRLAFNIYRLQIDRVRDAGSAYAVQLAEIEPLGVAGEEPDPMPLFADAISARGANPPLESAAQAFDGLKETKWLDLAEGEPKTRSSWIQWQYREHSSLVVTNLGQLSLLRGRAAEGYAVDLDGVLVGPGSGTNGLWVMDASGSIELSDVSGGGELLPGQRVRVAGRSFWNGKQVGLSHPALTAEGPSGRAEPKPILPGQTVASGEDFQWVRTEGVARFVIRRGNRLELELQENERSLSVQVLGLERPNEPLLAGRRLRVSGLCAGALDATGKRVASRLWVPGLRAISVLGRSEDATGALPAASSPSARAGEAGLLTEIRQIRRLSPEELARGIPVWVRGVVTEPFGSYIQQGADGVEILPGSGTQFSSPGLGEYVEVRGRTARGDARGPVVLVEGIRVLGEGKLPAPAHPSWTQLAGRQMNANWIEVEAVVWATDGSHLLLNCEGQQMRATIRSAPVAEVKALVDATVQLRGVCVNATDERSILQGIQLVVPSMEFVAVKEPPPPAATLPVRSIKSLYNLSSLAGHTHRVKVRGTLTGQEGRRYFVQDAEASLMAVAKAEVILSAQSPGSRWVFWQTPEEEGGGQPEEKLVPGDEVEITGFIESHGYAPMLTEALVRKVGYATAILPVQTTAKELARGRLDSTLVSLEGVVLGRETLGPRFVLQIQSEQRGFQASLSLDGRRAPNMAPGSRVRLSGVCRMEAVAQAGLGRTPAAFSLLLRRAGDIVVLEAPSWWTAGRALGLAGALVLVLAAAVGWIRLLHRRVEQRTRQLQQEVAEHEKTELQLAEETRLLQKEIEEHRRTEANLARKTALLEQEIEERKVLHRELAEKKASLEEEIEKRQRAQAEAERIHRQLLSASRLAGMAEVATSVLHNVGNVLNSVNVLAASIVSSLQRSKVPGVAQVAGLLSQHQADLGRFITEDENGRHVPALLERLGAHLLQEQKRLQEKAESLTENIQHIKEIVAMQQNYARVAGVREKLPVSDVVEDALRMCHDALARHEIKVVRDYQELPPVMLDRHKVLQILFNLLDNAKHACEGRDDGQGQVTVRIREGAGGRLQLQVIDNGIGIARENLSRIFTQGFSTRKGGHGFGLHGSILAAQDMGGSLTVESEGTGAGATFTLELAGVLEDSPVPSSI